MHAVCINAYAHAEEGSPQYEWLAADLSTVNRNATPWVLAFTHGPWYNSNEVHQGEAATQGAKKYLEPLLHAYGAGGVWAGHVHAYERTHPISPASESGYGGSRLRRMLRSSKGRSQRPVQSGVRDDAHGMTYVTIGDGGNREGLYDKWLMVEGRGGTEEPPEWAAFRNGSHYGRGDLVVVNATHLRWQWWPNGAAVAEDEAWITNPYYRLGQGSGSGTVGQLWWLAALLETPGFWAAVLLLWCLTIGAGVAMWQRRGVRFSAIRSSADGLEPPLDHGFRSSPDGTHAFVSAASASSASDLSASGGDHDGSGGFPVQSPLGHTDGGAEGDEATLEREQHGGGGGGGGGRAVK